MGNQGTSQRLRRYFATSTSRVRYLLVTTSSRFRQDAAKDDPTSGRDEFALQMAQLAAKQGSRHLAGKVSFVYRRVTAYLAPTTLRPTARGRVYFASLDMGEACFLRMPLFTGIAIGSTPGDYKSIYVPAEP
eukprot:gene10697-biopygen2925